MDEEEVLAVVDGDAEPPIRGLFLVRGLLPAGPYRWELEGALASCFPKGCQQVMLFPSESTAWPAFLQDLKDALEDLLAPELPQAVMDVLFPPPSSAAASNLQCILNLYPPGQGISPHVDLPSRYADGIVGISLCGAAAMEFCSAATPDRKHAVYLEPGDAYVLTGEARYDWLHGIPARAQDVLVRDGVRQQVPRELRMSISWRRMLPGAEVVGP